MIYIFGGSKTQSHHWADNRGIPAFKIQHIGSADVMKHVTKADRFIRAGTWYNRSDCKEIMGMAELKNITVEDA